MPLPCPESIQLTPAEKERLMALEGTGFDLTEPDYPPVPCNFTQHSADVPHAVSVQMQDNPVPGGPLIMWFAVWDEHGHREIKIAPECNKIVVQETCLLIRHHPGPCDQGPLFDRQDMLGAFIGMYERGELSLEGKPPGFLDDLRTKANPEPPW